MKTYGAVEISSTILDLSKMEVSGELHAPAALPPVPIE
jgi:hypothetical protein